MSTRHIRSMRDFMRHGIDIEVVCKCGKTNVLPWRPVIDKFNRKGWSMDLESAKMRFRCLGCRKYASRIGPRYR